MNEPSVTLHQQQGGMTLQAFAQMHGMTGKEMRRYAAAGRIVGARQDARSKKWTVFPPAKLIDKAGEPMTKRRKSRAAPPSCTGVMAACGHADTHPAQAVIGAAAPLPAKPVLALGFAALPGAARKYEHGDPILADAILDRLVHNANKLNLSGDSIRKSKRGLTKPENQE